MFKFTKEELDKFLKSEPFYKNPECFSLGENLKEAGEIYRIILEERDGVNVGMVCTKND